MAAGDRLRAGGVVVYAVEPSASVREDEPFVLPAQRPASPEIAESPSATTVSARAAAAGSAASATKRQHDRPTYTHPVSPPVEVRGIRPEPAWRKLGTAGRFALLNLLARRAFRYRLAR